MQTSEVASIDDTRGEGGQYDDEGGVMRIAYHHLIVVFCFGEMKVSLILNLDITILLLFAALGVVNMLDVVDVGVDDF